MAEFKERITKVELEGLCVEQFVNKNLLDKLRESLDIKPAVLVILAEKDSPSKKDKEGKPKKDVYPIIFEHNNSEEYKNKILKISCDNSEILDKVREALKKIGD
ncbi:MAG: hypothetical protein PHH82_04895 [Candidatus ainarchaeum sp.]|nr:hypothetical protein [Candidatus ainarchaeum sp.]